MSNGTKRLGKDFQGLPKFPSVTVSFNAETRRLEINFKNANWGIAVDLLVDGLQIARINEKKAEQESEPSRIVVPTLAGIPPLKEG